jgi:hypothetical protein
MVTASNAGIMSKPEMSIQPSEASRLGLSVPNPPRHSPARVPEVGGSCQVLSVHGKDLMPDMKLLVK